MKRPTLFGLAALVLVVLILAFVQLSRKEEAPGNDLIRVSSPAEDELVASPLQVTGEARGNWYFEASFPMELLDANGNQIALGIGEAQGDWMTTDFVPFRGTLVFTTASTPTGTLVLHKDNPSGLAEFDDEVRIPVRLNTDTSEVREVSLYYYNESKDKDAQGNIICSAQGLDPVSREIPLTISPVQDAVKLLLQGQLTLSEKNAGISTEFPLQDFTLQGASLVGGTLTLTFSDQMNKTSGGACRVSILRAQIEATAKQFEGVERVVIKPDTILQP